MTDMIAKEGVEAETVDVILPSVFDEPAPLAFQFQATLVVPLSLTLVPDEPIVKPPLSKDVIN